MGEQYVIADLLNGWTADLMADFHCTQEEAQELSGEILDVLGASAEPIDNWAEMWNAAREGARNLRTGRRLIRISPTGQRLIKILRRCIEKEG